LSIPQQNLPEPFGRLPSFLGLLCFLAFALPLLLLAFAFALAFAFVLAFAFILAFLVVIPEGDLRLFFSCHPSPKAEDLLSSLPLPFAFVL
jgi:hypothetical protein